ncbi:MAG: sensor histidine kinase [Verrucomicrobiales bacterium]
MNWHLMEKLCFQKEGRSLSRFQTKLLALVLLPLLPALGLALYANFHHRNAEKEALIQRIDYTSKLIAANQTMFFKNARQLLKTLERFDFLVSGSDKAFITVHLSNLLKLSPDYLNFGLVETNGTFFAQGAPLPPEGDPSQSDRSYFQKALSSKKFSAGNFEPLAASSNHGIDFAIPIMNAQKQPHRILFASVNLDLFTDSLKNIPLPPGGVVTVLDRAGTVLARVPDSDERLGKQEVSTEFIKTILRQANGNVEVPGLDGVKRLYAITPIHDDHSTAIYIAVGIPSKVLFAAADERIFHSIAVMALVSTLALGAAFMMAKRVFLEPVGSLMHAAKGLADGDLSTRVKLTKRASELNELSEVFNLMAANLQKRDADLTKAHAEIAKINADLEERVKARTEDLVKANKEMESFSYSVSHDLRAPLRHVQGYVQMLENSTNGALSEKSKRYLNVISTASEQMGRLIDDLLAYTRIGRSEIRKSEVDLNDVVKESLKLLESPTENRKIQWTFAELPKVVGDPVLLRLAFENLVGNAIKYSKYRDPAVIEIGCKGIENGRAVIFVRDNGAGFDMKYVHKLFGVFQRLHSSDEFEGTGIGLANVQRIAEKHGGEVWAEGKVDEGATFYLSLPSKQGSN